VPTVDPDRRETEPLGGRMVVEQTLRDVHDPILRQAHSIEHHLEVTLIGLIRADLLRGDDPVEADREAPI
jgi:hypothetical protein